ncbi:DOMON-like domain-containing protein [Chamaesiphon sp. VAR_69_metabat_338]|uniref:DOMON-like domain-containing protein n=1 Tax=Chamaesiphon sp. VAR_69_metabat_338 TaxID=2964704 RepID=UPI00286D883C|nr:DOMON-like domain-containing protein [Chamaesiphon sp. VAR_69_metabat_338]
MSNFKLHPFPPDRIVPQIEISGRIDRHDDLLAIEYLVRGDLNAISIDPPTGSPTRKLDLWTATCFEFFIGVAGSPNYWEFNLAPTGDWNVYVLDDYRQGLRSEIAFELLPYTINRSANSLILKLEFNLGKLIKNDLKLEVAVTAVIKSNQAEISYWALTHTGTEADFHRRDSFTIAL